MSEQAALKEALHKVLAAYRGKVPATEVSDLLLLRALHVRHYDGHQPLHLALEESIEMLRHEAATQVAF